MATLQRQPSPQVIAPGQVASVEGAPTAFPVDELAALRGPSTASALATVSPEASSSSVAEPPRDADSLGAMEADSATCLRDPFADEERTDEHPMSVDEQHPPPSYTDDGTPVPDYQERLSDDLADKPLAASRLSVDDDSFHLSGVSLLSEKRQQDFSHLSDAIDRLNVVAPQLHNQRVELAAGKQSELEFARMVGRGRMDDQYALAGKGKARAGADEQELQKIWESIEKAHGRRIDGQDSTLDLAQHAANEERRRGEFMNDLADRSDAGRLADQDWSVAQGPAEDQELITVDQFIHENARASSSSAFSAGPSHPSSPKLAAAPDNRRLSGSSFLGRRGSIKDSFARLVNGPMATEEGGTYVAEFQEHIRVIQVSLCVPEGGDFFLRVAADDPRTAILTSSNSTSAPLRLALPAASLPQDDSLVRPSSANTYSFRLSAATRTSDATAISDSEIPFSAASLAKSRPDSLLCATCDAPLVDCSAVQPADYSALPSEHWEELIGSWLCHDEMKLDLGNEGGGGVFWPKRSEILVGGTYLMLKESLFHTQSWQLRPGGESELWQPIVCARCSAPLGRRFLQPHSMEPSSTVKLLMYAFRLPDCQPPPLSTFIAQDLLELADSHRSYHFVLEAEEREGRPQLLIWLFNTSVFVTAGQTVDDAEQDVPSVRAAKVLYLDMGSKAGSTEPTIPGTFPVKSAETISYPAAVLDRLATVLAHHNGAFPPAGRQMMGLEVSWLERS